MKNKCLYWSCADYFKIVVQQCRKFVEQNMFTQYYIEVARTFSAMLLWDPSFLLVRCGEHGKIERLSLLESRKFA